MTAAEVKDALRRRHPASPVGSMVGQWVCLEEWALIDLIALNAWAKADVIGYEVKVSRSDYRSEILAPLKRAAAVAMCTEFYLAVPAGLLKPEEVAYEEPEWVAEDFEVPVCTNPECSAARERHGWHARRPRPRGKRLRGTEREGVSVRLGHARDSGVHPSGGTYTHISRVEACCAVCKGYGRVAGSRSRVEAEAPYLWVPRDVGLIEVDGRGCRVARRSPKRPEAPGLIPVADAYSIRRGRQALAQLVRWTSNRPDPRHVTKLAAAG